MSQALQPYREEIQMDRVMKDVVAPPMFPLGRDRGLDKKTGLPNLQTIKEHLLKEGRLTPDFASYLISQTQALFKSEPNMLDLKYPITVCGDLHGQFFDLIRLFEVGGDPRDTQYLFLGDYVDRGCFSCEVVLYLYALKISYPKSFYMLRGNHECRQLTSFFNFKDECVYKYSLQFYDEVMNSFDNLPLAALINKAFFCVHGGLSPDISSLDEVRSMDRIMEIPREGPMCVSKGTPVSLTTGISIPIEHLANHSVFGYTADQDLPGLITAQHYALIPKSQKECTEIVFSDGRSLVCTDDHRLLHDNQTWVETADLLCGDWIKIGVQHPVYNLHEQIASISNITFQQRFANFTFTNESVSELARFSAFARLFGFISSDLNNFDSTSLSFSMNRLLDVNTLIADTKAVTGATAQYKDNGNSYLVQLSQQLSEAMFALREASLNQLIPQFLYQQGCPVVLQSSFLSGFFSGAASAPSLNHDINQLTNITLKAEKFSPSPYDQNTLLQQISQLLDSIQIESQINASNLSVSNFSSFASKLSLCYSSQANFCLSAASIHENCIQYQSYNAGSSLKLQSPSTFFQQIGASAAFNNADNTPAFSRNSLSIPTLRLQIVAKHSVGLREVYDISVEQNIQSFCANGVVVHNCDLLWSDPYEEDNTGTGTGGNNPDATSSNPDSSSKGHQESTQWFGYNDTRQCSYVYGVEAVKQFLKDNKLTSVIRAHEAQVDGYKMQMINKSSGIPRVITIFSAPNYCDVYKNKAACLKFDNNVLNIKQFIDSPHPYYLPNFMDVFQWSLPFVAEKVTDMLANVLDFDVGAESEDDNESMRSPSIVRQRGGLLRKKVAAVTKLLRMYKLLRQESETVLALKQLTPNKKIPPGLLHSGGEGLQQALKSFEAAKQADRRNEKHPTPPNSPPPLTPPGQPRSFAAGFNRMSQNYEAQSPVQDYHDTVPMNIQVATADQAPVPSPENQFRALNSSHPYNANTNPNSSSSSSADVDM